MTLRVGRRNVVTLADILPDSGPIRMLIIGKTPAPVSVRVGHYFQGLQGCFMWSELRAFGLLDAPNDAYDDDALVRHDYGITDIVKVPRGFGSEPEPEEYGDGWPAVAAIIARLEPAITFWVYKRALDNVLRHAFGHRRKAAYGFNSSLNRLFGASVFAFGMIGTPCTRDERIRGMRALKRRLSQEH